MLKHFTILNLHYKLFFHFESLEITCTNLRGSNKRASKQVDFPKFSNKYGTYMLESEIMNQFVHI